jgi:hypothetical protein
MPETPKIASLKYSLYSNLGRYRRLTEQRARLRPPVLLPLPSTAEQPNHKTIPYARASRHPNQSPAIYGQDTRGNRLEAFSSHSSARLIGASGSWTILVQAARLVVPLPRRERREFRVGDSIRRAVESAHSSALKKQRTLFGIWLSFTSGLKSNRAFLSRVLPDDPERHRPRRPVMGELSLGDVAVSFVRR